MTSAFSLERLRAFFAKRHPGNFLPLDRTTYGPHIQVIGVVSKPDGDWLYWYDDRDETFWKKRRPAKAGA